MKTLFIECNMGAAGDMLMAALLELLPDPDGFINRMNTLGIPQVQVRRERASKCGIVGTHVSVRIGCAEEQSVDIPLGHIHAHSHETAHHSHSHQQGQGHTHSVGQSDGQEHGHTAHSHTGMAQIEALLNALPISGWAKTNVFAVYKLIAEAESKAHGRPVDAVHFHEVGMMDAVADIVGVCLLLEELAPERIVVSPIHVGSGQVKCAHGILPVPAPATASILQGVPTYGGQIKGELCTPTGAALLKHFADEFGDRPTMATEAIGYGMGKKDFPMANCVRVFMGETSHRKAGVVELACNLDDMTGEDLGFAQETLLENGALDVFTIPIQMKKGRPGQMLVCLCKQDDEERMAKLVLQHTTTLGVRCRGYGRYTLQREVETVDTKLGPIGVKRAFGFGVEKSKAEYEDLAKAAREHNLPIGTVRDVISQK